MAADAAAKDDEVVGDAAVNRGAGGAAGKDEAWIGDAAAESEKGAGAAAAKAGKELLVNWKTGAVLAASFFFWDSDATRAATRGDRLNFVRLFTILLGLLLERLFY